MVCNITLIFTGFLFWEVKINTNNVIPFIKQKRLRCAEVNHCRTVRVSVCSGEKQMQLCPPLVLLIHSPELGLHQSTDFSHATLNSKVEISSWTVKIVFICRAYKLCFTIQTEYCNKNFISPYTSKKTTRDFMKFRSLIS